MTNDTVNFSWGDLETKSASPMKSSDVEWWGKIHFAVNNFHNFPCQTFLQDFCLQVNHPVCSSLIKGNSDNSDLKLYISFNYPDYSLFCKNYGKTNIPPILNSWIPYTESAWHTTVIELEFPLWAPVKHRLITRRLIFFTRGEWERKHWCM